MADSPNVSANSTLAQFSAFRAQDGLTKGASPLAGDMKTWIKDIKRKEAREPWITDQVKQQWPAVQSLVDAQKEPASSGYGSGRAKGGGN